LLTRLFNWPLLSITQPFLATPLIIIIFHQWPRELESEGTPFLLSETYARAFSDLGENGDNFLFYLVSPSIQSHLTNSPEENEPLSTGTIVNQESNEQNQSILSFPDHDTPLSQQSEELINDDSQLRLDAQILVDDSIQNAQEKYQRVEITIIIIMTIDLCF